MATIEATPNYAKRTFTLREKSKEGKTIAKHRTFSMGLQEFEEEEFNTSNDWKNYINTQSNTYEVK